MKPCLGDVAVYGSYLSTEGVQTKLLTREVEADTHDRFGQKGPRFEPTRSRFDPQDEMDTTSNTEGSIVTSQVTDCNYGDDHAADVEDVGYPIRTGSFGDRETLVGRCHVLLLPTKRVCGSVGDLDRNVVRRDKRDCIFLKGDK